ncbi:diguanylate cyclase (GGDEF)-like protein [Melghiribacillus thermohalophilus]|uniref:Diguanylate cyclase (GGDEF)-like protein n=1 Tax=Melghiribacillus thermohalophilus TaxID=1324956 RepID=A0A4R3N6R2_9BACI|nr:diguanylate cyclase [Melghiribacillus thermohalophilus]TCT24948.1 diguanylate cyclase (GGDEF)-like protein [Melghiribacillus thermohalophilus]
MKNKAEPNLYIMEQLRNQFYELMTVKSHINFQYFARDLAGIIRDLTEAKTCAIYLKNEYTDTYERYGKDISDEELESHDVPGSGMPDEGVHDQHQEYRLPLRIENKDYGFLLLVFDRDKSIEGFRNLLQDISRETVRVLVRIKGFFAVLNEEKKYEQLYRVTSKFHASIRMEDVLNEMIFTLEQIYPDFEYHLYLSQDDAIHEQLPIRIISFDLEQKDHASSRAYLTGEIQLEDRRGERQSCLYAPLKGKQGVYGVLEILAPESVFFPEKDIEFISLLANTAGNALENARLYQQSKKLVEDLQLINRTSQRLNMNLSLSDTISFISKQTLESFKAEEVGVLLYVNHEWNDYELQTGSTAYFFSAEGKRFVQFLNGRFEKEKDPLFIGDFAAKFPDYPFGFQSVMAIPMIQDKKMIGLVVVLHRNSYHFSFETFKLFQSIVQHSALTVINSMLKEELEQLVKTDYLTKLFSRKYLDESLHQHMKTGQKGAFLMMDIDDFKQVNDQYGHHVGDQIIIQVAEVIKNHIAYKDVAARWGGEELAVYIPDATLEEAQDLSERIVHAVAGQTRPAVTVSCGVSYWNNGEQDQVKDVFIRADRALYAAKESGKNCVRTQYDLEL